MMKVGLNPLLNDAHLDANQTNTQRQLAIGVSAIASTPGQSATLPLNLCLVLDHSGSMNGQPLKTVKQAAIELVEQLQPSDRLSVIAFDHRAKVIVPNQPVTEPDAIKKQIATLEADGGTAIDAGMKLGMEEAIKGKQESTSHLFVLTDGENEHGNNERCLKLAHLASEQNITVNSLGFGSHWNQDVLEKIADTAGGTLSYIEDPDQAAREFSRLFSRAQSVGLTNAYLQLELHPEVRLAALKPIAQVAPETIELVAHQEGNFYSVRLGDLMREERLILVNLYLSQMPPGSNTIASVSVRYDDPALGKVGLVSERIPVNIESQVNYRPLTNAAVLGAVLALAKYRQTQIAEAKLQDGDRVGAATMLQTAAKTALQMGDRNAATVLQHSATQLQMGGELSEADRKKTRIVSKTILQG